MEWVTTSTILHGLRDFGNRTAWELFVERFRKPLAAFVTRMGVRAPDVDDVVQESFVAFAETHRDGRYDRDRGRLNQWLFGIAYRQALRQRRRYGGKEVVIENRPGDTPFLDGVPDERAAADMWNRLWDEFLLSECLTRIRKEIPADQYRIFELSVLGELSAPEVAEHLGVEVKHVYNVKHRSLKRLRAIRAELEAVAAGPPEVG